MAADQMAVTQQQSIPPARNRRGSSLPACKRPFPGRAEQQNHIRGWHTPPASQPTTPVHKHTVAKQPCCLHTAHFCTSQHLYVPCAEPHLRFFLLNPPRCRAPGGENGFNQAIELSAETLANVKFVQEKRLISRWGSAVLAAACCGLLC